MDRIEELLTRGVDTIYSTKAELEKVLRSGKKLKLYQGFDPTGTQLHIGHMVGLRKLRQWQDAGHHVIFLIGDGTGQAGDPSGKTTARDKFFTREELRANAVDYVKQAGKIVRFEGENPVEIRFNGDWLNKLTLVDILDIAGHFTLQQLTERDLFQERMKRNEPVNLREFLYPLLQGYDSVAMKVDLELGGSDQTFNMLVGRDLVRAILQKEKFVMTTPLLTDSQGRKIGKTEGNVIALTDAPEDLYGKIMSLPDDVIVRGFEYLTDVPMEAVKKIEKDFTNSPVEYKKQLAFEIVKQLNTDEDAKKAQEYFEKTVQKKELPSDIKEIQLSSDDEEIIDEDFLVDLGLVSSKSEAKRLMQQGGVEVDGKRLTGEQNLPLKNGMIIKVGKRRIVKLKTAR
ncbi:MAG: tyrosine--tRNA ligase [Candidatus Levybacteria bacterium]|nr:tyrosine--tRNA ligase [Candidatus Levybacteria bacterium]